MVADDSPGLVMVADDSPELVMVADDSTKLVMVADNSHELVMAADESPELVLVADDSHELAIVAFEQVLTNPAMPLPIEIHPQSNRAVQDQYIAPQLSQPQLCIQPQPQQPRQPLSSERSCP